MMQFYFLSVALNALTGFVLFKDDGESGFVASLRNSSFRLVLGICTAIMGVLSILAATDIPVVGDLLPAFAGLAGGVSLIFEFYKSKTTVVSENTEKVQGIVEKYKKPLGIVCLATAIVHFIIPGVLFL
ncbi:MAG: hypothetical protein LBM77_05855 [Spirochaetaceae bacterium]|jgi:hypothetical protein|nr:hypothetical protein [Spirochaetaceae bacterium]